MKKPAPYVCDGEGCTEERKPSNGWFLLQDKEGTLVVSGWDDTRADLPLVKHYCGQTCVVKAVSTALTSLRH